LVCLDSGSQDAPVSGISFGKMISWLKPEQAELAQLVITRLKSEHLVLAYFIENWELVCLVLVCSLFNGM
jgi:hypothetical protein